MKLKWKKLGLIFNPTDHQLPLNAREYAQSPQALVFDNFVRIYFSTRSIDEKGMFLSQIAFADFSRDLRELKGVSSEAVLPLGKLGTFDEHGIFPISPFQDGDRILAFTCGWSRRVAVPVETSIGLAVSNDQGLTFTRIGDGPVLSSSTLEPVLVGDGFVCKFGELYHMWYIFGRPWKKATADEPPARVYKIAYASSKDCINWDKQEGREIIANVIDDDECQALPTVIEHEGFYHMVFCYRHSSDFRKNMNRGYRLGYAYSKDLKEWHRNDELLNMELSENDWDSEMMCYPNLFKVGGEVFLLYNGNNFGRGGFGAAKLIASSESI